MPATFEAQVRQSLDNVKSVVEAAGLTMDHVVYTQVYLEDISKYREVNQVFADVFPKTPPARAVLGVAKLPESPIQINAVAVRNLADRRAIVPAGYKSDESASPGMLTHDRLFVSAMPGSDPATRQGSGRSCRASRFRARPHEGRSGSCRSRVSATWFSSTRTSRTRSRRGS